MLVKKMLIGILLSFGLTQAHADTPIYYSCKGKNISLVYDISNPANSILVSLKIGKKTYTADEANIETQTTAMGDVKTVVIKITPDVEVRKASFIIPTINLGLVSGHYVSGVTFKSQLILTTIATPFISNPYIGVVNKSNYIDLICDASIIIVAP